MNYRILTDDTKREALAQQLVNAEASHYIGTVVGDEHTVAQFEGQIARLHAELDRLDNGLQIVEGEEAAAVNGAAKAKARA